MQYVLPCPASPNSLSTPYRLHCGRLLAIVCAGGLPSRVRSTASRSTSGQARSPRFLPCAVARRACRLICGDEPGRCPAKFYMMCREFLAEMKPWWNLAHWIVWQGELCSVPLEPCPHKVSALHFVRETVWASMDACWGCVVVSSSMRGVTVVWCPLPLFSYMDSNAPLSHQVPLLTGAHRVRTR